jgi:hypothetical protein
MINTRVKYNILLKETIRTLRCVIYDIKGFRLLIVTRDEFGFNGLAKVRIKIIKGVSYKDIFFLVEGTLKILLR